MPSAAQLRTQIESVLAKRIPSALTPAARTIRPTVPSGVAAIDELLQGGLPIGAISEVTGPECSGRTTLAMSLVAGLTQAGQVCAWVDVSDAFDVESAAANGVDLARLLWVRCGVVSPSQVVSSTTQNQQQYLQICANHQPASHGAGSPHPRSEERGMPAAVSELLSTASSVRRDKSIGTPGVKNRPLFAVRMPREEQIPLDRQPKRRGENILDQRDYEPRCATPQHKTRPQTKHFPTQTHARAKASHHASVPAKPWNRLDQALRVADLILMAGGFSAMVLDLGSIEPEHASRIPLAMWFRFRAAADHARTSLLLLTQHSCAKSSAGLLLRMQSAQVRDEEKTVFTGFHHQVEAARIRFVQEPSNMVPVRKPPQRVPLAVWQTRASSAGSR